MYIYICEIFVLWNYTPNCVLGFNVIDWAWRATCSFLCPKMPANRVARPRPMVVNNPMGFQSSAVDPSVAVANVPSVLPVAPAEANVPASAPVAPAVSVAATDWVPVSTPSDTAVLAGAFGVTAASVDD